MKFTKAHLTAPRKGEGTVLSKTEAAAANRTTAVPA